MATTTTLILLTLLPTGPRDAEAFHDDLSDLVIDVYDLTVNNANEGIRIGSASGVTQDPYFTDLMVVPGTPPQPDKLRTPIIQHFIKQEVQPPTRPPRYIGIPQSVATAVIVVDIDGDPATPEYEFDSYDLRIVLSRVGGTVIGRKPQVEFNVPTRVIQGSMPVDPQIYIDFDYDIANDPLRTDPRFRAAYVFVPPKPRVTPSTRPSIVVSADGMTPVFDDLVAAVNIVLEADHSIATAPGDPTSLQERTGPLTTVQCQQVARELVYDRVIIPLPNPERKTLETMYGNPGVSVQDDQDRKQFEANLTSYHAQHDAEALQLAGYIFAASAAIECEKQSLRATSARLMFNVVTHPPDPRAPFPSASVVLKGLPNPPSNIEGPLDPSFGVPAAFFYALGASSSSQLSPEDRYRAAVTNPEDSIINSLQAAQDAGVLNITESALTSANPNAQNLVIHQAARRLTALGATAGSRMPVDLDSSISDLVGEWLAYQGKTADIDAFWVSESSNRADQYLELLLNVIVAEKSALKDAIKMVLNVQSASDLPSIKDEAWRNFFMPPNDERLAGARAGLLPEYTLPGDTRQRTEAFIRFIKRLFSVEASPINPVPQHQNTVPVLSRSARDCLQLFLDALPGFSFANPLDDNAIALTVSSLPIDQHLKDWTNEAIHVIHFLYQVTNLQPPNNQPPELQFSLMEALYARGFNTADRVAILSQTQFHAALAGTVAYPKPISDAIYNLARPMATIEPDGGPEPGFNFTPINPGDLVDCVPPPNLSPLGPVAYLKAILELTVISGSTTVSLLEVVGSRRGPVGTLKATLANMEAILPLIDLANESLEALVSGLPITTSRHGAVYDTDPASLAGFRLGDQKNELNPEKARIAIPQYSGPSTRVASPAAYKTLQTDCSSPCLPYSRELDINRTYLCAICTSRFQVMRAFRRDITEFVIDPSNEPTDFQQNLWRLPVRLDIAIEYLCISEDERSQLFQTTLDENALASIYGYSPVYEDWTIQLSSLPVFLERTGLTYCDFFELWKSGFVDFKPASTVMADFPSCEPCCLKAYHISFPQTYESVIPALQKLAVFVRLWRKLQHRYGQCRHISFPLLRAICEVLHLFNGDDLNEDFLRQLIALLMLCENFCLPLCEEPCLPEAECRPQDRVKILALWTDPTSSPEAWEWAVSQLLDRVEAFATHECHCPSREAGFKKILEGNLAAISRLVGFTDNCPWNAKPTCTLRFAEILSKIYSSSFSIGEILFLFTNSTHLVGNDPFPYTEASESLEDPLNVPEDSAHGLWELRNKLCRACVDEEEIEHWTWRRIECSLRMDFGLVPSTGTATPDSLISLGEHFFPSILECCGHPVPTSNRQFRTGLNPMDTSIVMWECTPHEPFHYSSSTSELWMQLPLRDEDVLHKLAHIRQLRAGEIKAIQELYFAPRLMLTPFTMIFGDLAEAIDCMVQECCEEERFAYFQRCFALFHQRCKIIAQHLAMRVERVMDCFADGRRHNCDMRLAWRILQSLVADENRSRVPWERDSGESPDRTDFLWDPKSSGSAFSALLGLVGTGILGEYRSSGTNFVWKEIRGPLAAFGHALDEQNVPVPTIIPRLNISPTPQQRSLVMFRNGFALSDLTARTLGGAQPFTVKWEGVLLVEESGQYTFHIHRPSFHREPHDEGGEHSSHECCDEAQWIVKLRRGQKMWTLLNHQWHSGETAPRDRSLPVCLLRGAYDIEVCFKQREPLFKDESPLRHMHTGFGVQYCGPDTADEVVNIPRDKLFVKLKDGPLSLFDDAPDDHMHLFLRTQYVSSLRDIRRTYQRAFKAVLFAHHFCLSDEPDEYCHGETELEYILGHPVEFQGTSYRLFCSSYVTHHANFDFNLLPVNDAYFPPDRTQDDRASPSDYRTSALFDWWERFFDYKQLFQEVCEHSKDHRGPIWLLFHEAATQQPSNATSLVRHLGVDLAVAPLTLTYFNDFTVGTTDLEDERWTTRVWHAWNTIQRIQRALFSKSLDVARPDLWAATSPGQIINPTTSPPLSGNGNLTYFVSKSLLLDSDVPHFATVKNLNDGVRVRGNKALIAYLCSMDRVLLDFTGTGTTAKTSEDLSALLLQEVEVGLCERSSRIEEAIYSVQTFVQRMRLGLEPTYQFSPAYGQKWDAIFCTFDKWKNHQRRVLYKENWIQWDELALARESEAFHFLESNLDRHSLILPAPTPPFAWPMDERVPRKSSHAAIQFRDLASLRKQTSTLDEGIGLLGTPARHARLSWLTSVSLPPSTPAPSGPGGDGNGERNDRVGDNLRSGRLPSVPDDQEVIIPMWFQAAVRLGTTFIRIAAAGHPPAIYSSLNKDNDDHSQIRCGRGETPAPVMDEYYFWLARGEYFDSENAPQNADVGVVSPDPTTAWENESILPTLLHWPTRQLVHLHWTRVHFGTFSPPRRSAEGVPVDSSSEEPTLTFTGRKADSLRFVIDDESGKGFRYDIATDSAVMTPQAIEDTFPTEIYPEPFHVYPFFIYFNPGAPISPVSSFATALSIAGSLRAQCRFEEALVWCKVIFDPLHRENNWPQCARLPEMPPEENIPEDTKDGAAVAKVDAPCCPTSPVKTGIARARAVVLEYLQILLEWGNALMCRNSRDASKQALVLFNEAVRILGPQPSKVHAQDNGIGQRMTVADFVPASAVLNPRLIALYEIAFDRKGLVQHCLDAHRLDRAQKWPTRSSWAEYGEEACRFSFASDTCRCVECQCWPSYRFSYLLPKALELAVIVRSLGSSLLSAFEKGDTEYLASLHQSHDRQLNELMLSNKQSAYREADWQAQALKTQLEGAQTRLRYHQQLLKMGLNAGEHAYLSGTSSALESRTAGNVSEVIGQGMSFIPDITVGGAGFCGSPVEVNKLPVGSKLASVFQAAARMMNTAGDISSTNAGLSSTTGGWDRRADEWQHQVDMITIEISQIKRQQLAALRRRDMSLRDLNNHKEQVQHSAEVGDFLRDKISKHDLYHFLQQETVALHRRVYDLAYETARDAQAAFQYEKPDLDVQLPVAGWDNLSEGLMAGERLEFALHSMDRLYMRFNCREYELAKHISLRLHFPLAFLQLKAFGWCEIEIPEWMFDVDYPGHYMRRIKNVSVTLPAIVGPYTGVHCRLQLLSSGIRFNPSIPIASRCCCRRSCEDQQVCAYDGDHNLSRQFIGSESIATSSGQNDSGLFELSFRDERFVPFEFSGAISRWRIVLPSQNNQFDLETLSDFVMHLNYTAREGGPALREAADRSAQRHLPGDGTRFFDVRHEFPSSWQKSFTPKNNKKNQHSSDFPLQFSRRAFPFLTGRRSVTISRIHLFVEVDRPCEIGAHFAVHFLPEGGCREDRKTFVCTSSDDLPASFYHGVLEHVCLGPLEDDKDHVFGHLRFQEELQAAHIQQVYFLCCYFAPDHRLCC